jgi:hypothetical protein
LLFTIYLIKLLNEGHHQDEEQLFLEEWTLNMEVAKKELEVQLYPKREGRVGSHRRLEKRKLHQEFAFYFPRCAITI